MKEMTCSDVVKRYKILQCTVFPNTVDYIIKVCVLAYDCIWLVLFLFRPSVFRIQQKNLKYEKGILGRNTLDNWEVAGDQMFLQCLKLHSHC